LVFVAPALVLASLLAVVGAQAVLTEGQVRLTGLQAQEAAAQAKRFDLQLRVAQEEQPSAVVAAARAQGMVVPSSVTDISAVDPGPSITSEQQAGGHGSRKSAKGDEPRNAPSGSTSGTP